jgi:hypothetical protein
MVFIRVSILAMLSGCAMLSADTATIGIAGGSVAGDQKTSATKDSDKWNESKMDHDRLFSASIDDPYNETDNYKNKDNRQTHSTVTSHPSISSHPSIVSGATIHHISIHHVSVLR